MKKIILLCIALPAIALGQTDPNFIPEQGVVSVKDMQTSGLYEKFVHFTNYVNESRTRTETQAHIVILPMDGRSPFGDEAWSMKLEHGDHGIYITTDLLKRSDKLWLENIAQHEVCHVALGHHENRFIDIETQAIYEIEACACTQQYLGEKKSVKFLAEFMFLPYSNNNKKSAVKSSRAYAKILSAFF